MKLSQKLFISTLLAASPAFAEEFYPRDPEGIVHALVESDIPGLASINWEKLEIRPLEDFTGSEDLCSYASGLDTALCLDSSTLYLDSNLLATDHQEIKIGGSIGKALGKVTNPIRDNVTAPIGKGLEHLGGQTVQQFSRLTGIPEDRVNCVVNAAATYVAAGQCKAWTGAAFKFPYVTALWPVSAATCYRTVEGAKDTADSCRWLKP